MEIKLDIKGLDEVTKKFQNLPRNFVDQMSEAMWAVGYFIEGKAKPLVPVDTGRLRAATQVWDRKPLEVTVGAHTDYALFVHENLRAHHNVGQAKFLEDPANRYKAQIEDIINNAISKLLDM